MKIYWTTLKKYKEYEAIFPYGNPKTYRGFGNIPYKDGILMFFDYPEEELEVIKADL